MRDSFSFEYTPNLPDARTAIRLSQWGSPSRKARTIFLSFVFPACLMMVLLRTGATGFSVSEAAAMAVAFSVAWGILFRVVFNEWLARYVVKRQLRNGAVQHVVVDRMAVEHRGTISSHRVSWESVTNVHELERAFLLMVGDRPVGSIEKTAIRSKAELEELRRLIASIRPLAAGAGKAMGAS
jgi:hypothetical protein